MYRYLLQLPDSSFHVVTAKSFRKALPKGSTIRQLKRRHWVQCRAQELLWKGQEPRGLLRGPRDHSAYFCV